MRIVQFLSAKALALLVVMVAVVCPLQLIAADDVIHLKLEPEGMVEANYYLWVPENVKKVRGVIVHQHGCGEGSERSGETAAWDLHWRELARKWDCALLGTRYRPGGDCKKWCVPANGSEAAFLYALKRLGELSKHPELESAPWCLWGHSGGALWSHLMFAKYPERTIAVFLRSGAAELLWESGDLPKPKFNPLWLTVPVICNPGFQEKTHERFHRAWDGQIQMFEKFRERGGFIAFAPDPISGHNCGHQRFLAIPFFDACLDQRLPGPHSMKKGLGRIDPYNAWLGATEGNAIRPSRDFDGEKTSVSWLPNERVANAWQSYTKTGTVKDYTPPFTPPFNLAAKPSGADSLTLTWEATPDFESGINGFVIYRDGLKLTELKGSDKGTQIAGQFQKVTYSDTPVPPVRELKFEDKELRPKRRYTYEISMINGSGIESEKSKPLTASVTQK